MSIYDTTNNYSQTAKRQAIKASQNQNAQNTLGSNYASELATYQNAVNNNDLYKSQIGSLSQQYADLDTQRNNLLKGKYGDDYTGTTWDDYSDQIGYNEYMRLTNLMTANQRAQDNLNNQEIARQVNVANQDAIRQQQQKYLDTYAKMQGMGYGGYSSGLQAQAYNDYANRVGDINQDYSNYSNDIVNSYKNMSDESELSKGDNERNIVMNEYANFENQLNNISTLEELDELEGRYEDVLERYKNYDRDFEANYNKMRQSAFINSVANIGEDNSITPKMSSSEFSRYKSTHSDDWNRLSDEYKNQLNSLYNVTDTVISTNKNATISGFTNKSTGWDDDVTISLNGKNYAVDLFYPKKRNQAMADGTYSDGLVANLQKRLSSYDSSWTSKKVKDALTILDQTDANEGDIKTYGNVAWIYTSRGWALMEYKGKLKKAYDLVK